MKHEKFEGCSILCVKKKVALSLTVEQRHRALHPLRFRGDGEAVFADVVLTGLVLALPVYNREES